MKKIFSVLLALAMMLSSFVAFAEENTTTTAASTQFSDVQAGSKVEEAVTKLVVYDIISGYPDGTFKPDGEITRGEFAAVITRFKGIASNLPADAVTGFKDLDNDSSRAWVRPYVKAAVDSGIINGFDDGTFRAGEPVTYEQAVKMIICAIEYNVIADSEYKKLYALNPQTTTWSAGYLAAANKNGITLNALMANVTANASRGIVAILTSNALDAPKLNVSTDNEGNTSYEKDDATVGEDRYDSNTKIEGIVTETYYTGLDTQDPGLKKSEIKIETEEDTRIYTLSRSLSESLDLVDIVGKEVTCYYSNADREITTLKPETSGIVISEDKVLRPLSGTALKYRDENYKTVTENLSSAVYIYNGKYMPGTNLSDFESLFQNGEIEILDNGIDKVVKFTSYDVLVVNSKSISDYEEKLHFKYGKGTYEFPARDVDKPEIYLNGAKKEFAASLFAEWYVINLLESPSGSAGNHLKKMYITSGRKSGKVTETFSDPRRVKIGNSEIILSRAYLGYAEADRVTFEMNNTYTYYLDYTGQIAAVDKKSASTTSPYSYGYLITAGDERVSLILKDGTHKVATMKQKVKVDGVTTNREDVAAKLDISAEIIYPGESGHSQPVKYYITNDELAGIDTIADKDGIRATTIGSNSEDAFVYNDTGSATPSTSSVTLNGSIYDFPSSTIVVYVPTDRTSADSYSFMAPSKAFVGSSSRTIKILGADTENRIKNAAMVLIYEDDGIDPLYKITGSTPYMIVTGKPNSKTIEGYKEGAESTDTITISEDRFETSKSGNIRCVSASAVDKGDIIRYLVHNNEVIAIEMVYDASDDSEYFYTAGDTGANDMVFSAYTTGNGEVYMKYTEAVQVDEAGKKMYVTTKIGTATEDEKLANRLTYGISGAVVYRAEGDDIIAEKVFDNIGVEVGNSSEVIMITRGTGSTPTAKTIYIVD